MGRTSIRGFSAKTHLGTENMNNNPIVSVLVPNYNHEKYLAARIESIINQSYTDFELILMDDYSTDGSRDIIARYASNPRVRIAFNEQNSGSTFRQWKKGLAMAKGKYLWIAESDDYADLHFLETLVAILEKDDTVGLAYSNSIIVDENSRVVGNMVKWKNCFFCTNRWDKAFINDGIDEIDQYLGSTCTINNASAVLIRKEALLQSGGIDDSFRYAGDWLTYLKIALHYRIAYSPSPLNYYRDHSQNVSKKAEANSALLMERILCLGFIHEKLGSAAQRKKRLEQAADEYATVVHRCMRSSWQPVLLGMYIKKIFSCTPRFAVKLHAQLAVRIVGGGGKKKNE